MSTSDLPPDPWLAPWFHLPGRAELPTGHHLRPLRAADAVLPGLPTDLDLSWVVAVAAPRTAVAYGVFDDEERAVHGVVRLAPGAAGSGHDVVVSWWVPDGSPLDAAIAAFVPCWVASDWPFTSPSVLTPVRRHPS